MPRRQDSSADRHNLEYHVLKRGRVWIGVCTRGAMQGFDFWLEGKHRGEGDPCYCWESRGSLIPESEVLGGCKPLRKQTLMFRGSPCASGPESERATACVARVAQGGVARLRRPVDERDETEFRRKGCLFAFPVTWSCGTKN